MTNPVILYGTQSNGETFPVQVDGTGRLVAEGLQGQPGQEGPPGPPGADGGDFPLPPDPYEGAFLGWLNGGLAWLGTPPTPIPPEVFGPITAWDPAGLLTVEGPIPSQVGNGVYLTQCDQDGTPVGGNAAWNVSSEWTQPPIFLSPEVPALDGFPVTNIFDGTTSTQGLPTANGVWTWAFTEFPEVTQMMIWWEGNANFLKLNGKTLMSYDNSGNSPANLTGKLDEFTRMQTEYISGADYCYIKQVQVNNKILVYKSLGGVYGRVSQVVNDSQLLIAKSTSYNFEVGQYLRIDENQRVAPWVLRGVDPTTDIDFLRST